VEAGASVGGDLVLTLPEEVLLLYLGPASSDTARRVRELNALVNPAARLLAAARLIELVLAGRVTVESRRGRLLRSEVIVLEDSAPTGDAALDEVLRWLDESRPRSCASWIKRAAGNAEVVYRDRLLAKSLLAPDARTGVGERPVADEAAFRTVRERIQAVLDRSAPVDAHDIALVTLLAYTESLSALLNDPSAAAAGVIETTRANRRAERLGREAFDAYMTLEAPDAETRRQHASTADAIKRIAAAAAPESDS
jgi:hypothetical protein